MGIASKDFSTFSLISFNLNFNKIRSGQQQKRNLVKLVFNLMQSNQMAHFNLNTLNPVGIVFAGSNARAMSSLTILLTVGLIR